jgi:putative FmdB family regulatory protein
MPQYDYRCSECGHVWDEYHKMSDNKFPESLPCPECMTKGTVLQTIAFSVVPLSHVRENNDAFKKLNRSKFAEKLNQIHRETPGSNLHNTSSIVEVK